MKKRVEIIPADHDVQLNFYIITASYILLLISIEPITDYFLMININGMNLSMINVINEKKKFITHTAYGMLRMLPMLLSIMRSSFIIERISSSLNCSIL